MTIAVTSPITGLAQAGLTTPTYTIVADTPPDINAKQWAVTALGGTQTGVTVHSANSPFTITAWRPRAYKALPKPNPVTGVINNVPFNTYIMKGRKGAVPLAGQVPQVAECDVRMKIPAGSETASPQELRAMLSMTFGALSQQSSGIGDTIVQGLLG